ncbi:hypothetical protein P3X46_020564 [Hevea brasiliensis]|uniref:Uncharacterized protein n=1 Tax=Hevea brasiliensis TaxID=3981 RepID=A0ABQ9LM88_HEVBR|nr:uncharacterized protein LOC131170475 [Hevea brasiliensis]KAJ9169097.1 hypothetical protein P3X46_020564 [Hevea brasiliensis]
MEGATKWDPRCSRTADKLCYFCVCMKLLKDHANSTASVASFIQAELFHAQLRIQELEAEQQSFQKEVKHLLKKLEEKTTSWLRREHQKMNAVLNDLKNDLSNQRKKYQTMEIISSELVNEMADVKLSEKQFKKDYEEEKKGRELMEEVCKELARKSAEEKAMLEAMKMESIKIWEEVEEERKMLQIAEVWPEERVQMKLTDATLALEDKYCEMNKLIADFEAFLMSGSATLDVRELRKAELFIQAAKSVNIEDIKEFSYMPSKPSDVYSILEEVKQLEADKRMVEQCSKYSPVSGVSTIQTEQTASSVAKQCNSQHLLNYSNGSIANNSQFEEYAKAWESHSEEEVSSYSLEGSNTTVNGIKIREGNCKNAWQSAREWKETIRNDSLNTQMSGFCSAEQSSHNIPFTAALLGSSSLSNSRRSKITFDDGRDWRSSNDTISSLKRTSPKRKLCEGRPRLLRDLANPHVTRGMKGWIEWPRQIQKNSLKKAKLLQVSLESQKAHLRSFFERKT